MELEGLATRVYSHALGGLWGEKKKEEDWQQMLAQDESFPAKKPPKTDLLKKKSRMNSLQSSLSDARTI